MALATEHYRALLEETDLKKLKDAEATANALRKIVADTQQLTLSQLNDSVSRQLGSILFSHEAGLVSALSAVNPPEINIKKPKGFPASAVFALCGVLITAAATSLAWGRNEILLGILSLCGAILCALAGFWPHKKPEVTAAQSVDAEALFRLTERRMEAIDRDMEAFMRLPTVDDDADEGVLQLILKAITLKREDPDSVPDELMTAITAITISRGYRFLEYTGEEDMFFDIMPTKRETRTIVPAVVKDDRLIARGMAIVRIEQPLEEQIG